MFVTTPVGRVGVVDLPKVIRRLAGESGRGASVRGRPFVVVETPFGAMDEAEAYAEAVCRHVYDAGGMPFASHLHWPRFMVDALADERADGIEAGHAVADRLAALRVFGLDLGMSQGMVEAWRRDDGIPQAGVVLPWPGKGAR